MSAGSSFLVLGLKGSGKTSYLAALWHLLESGEIRARLTLPALQPDREYLNQIRDSWLRFEEVGRTSLRTHESLSLVVRDSTSKRDVSVTLPDWSGESLRLQWAMRKAPPGYVEFARKANGLLVFVHPESVKKTYRLRPSVDLLSTANTGLARTWSPDAAPTQVQLVELLQFASWLRQGTEAARFAVVISAWDRIRSEIGPRSWLENRLPLLYQYLVTNEGTAPFKIFGVSAQGGDLKEDLDSLQKRRNPSERVRVVFEDLVTSNDLTEPLWFLMGQTPSVHRSIDVK